MLKAAVVGVNFIGKLHCRYYQQNEDVQLVAVCDLNEQLAKAAGAEFSVRVYTDLQTMLDQEDLDLVSVATGGIENGSHHYEPTMELIRTGKAVLLEKPISNSIEEAKAMVQLAKENKVRFACNLNHRFNPTAYRAKQWIEQGDLGELLFINMKLTIGNPNESSPWMHMRALHPHSIDVMRYLAGDIIKVQSFMMKAPGRSTWSTASINLQFSSGAVGHLTGSYDMFGVHPIEHCEVAGNKGRLVLENIYENLTFYPHQSDELKVFRNSLFSGMNGFLDTFKHRIDAFVKQIKDDVPPGEIHASGADALAVQEVIEAAIQSQINGGAVIELGKM
ncbi:MAG TPA: Gfo/Idh/MocA family oxidoreductase [Bacilli bacterium]